MGETYLSLGLIPAGTNPGPASPATQLAFLWAGLSFHVQQFGANPIGQAFIAWTVAMLCERGYHPTISELAQATGMSRATVSRYVSHHIERGDLEERINAQDRRRRELFLTSAGVRTINGVVRGLHDLYATIQREGADKYDPESGADLLAQMIELTRRVTCESA